MWRRGGCDSTSARGSLQIEPCLPLSGGPTLMGTVMSASAAQNTFYFFHISPVLATREASPKGQCQKTPAHFVLLFRGERPCFSSQDFSFSAERLNPVRGQTQHYFRKWLGFKPNPLNISFIQATKTSPPKRSSTVL